MFYVKINGTTFEVDGTRTVPKTWIIACEHGKILPFKGICIRCAIMLAKSINPELTGKRYITNWENIEFLS